MRALGALLLAGSLVFGLPVAAQPVLSESRPAAVTGIRIVTIAKGLERPWALAFLPDGNMLVTERRGRLRLVRDGTLDPRPIAGVPEVHAEGQGGLLDVALHPDFTRNGTIFLSYAHGTAAANRTRVARAVYDPAAHALRDLRVIFEVNREKQGSQHFGSRILVLPDGTLLASIGDGGNPPASLGGRLIRENAQDLSNHIGSVVRIAEDGSVPRDNPFVGRAGFAPEIWSWGHRNNQGLAWDPRRRSAVSWLEAPHPHLPLACSVNAAMSVSGSRVKPMEYTARGVQSNPGGVGGPGGVGATCICAPHAAHVSAPQALFHPGFV